MSNTNSQNNININTVTNNKYQHGPQVEYHNTASNNSEKYFQTSLLPEQIYSNHQILSSGMNTQSGHGVGTAVIAQDITNPRA